jgi:hypothetical protein
LALVCILREENFTKPGKYLLIPNWALEIPGPTYFLVYVGMWSFLIRYLFKDQKVVITCIASQLFYF